MYLFHSFVLEIIQFLISESVVDIGVMRVFGFMCQAARDGHNAHRSWKFGLGKRGFGVEEFFFV